MVVRKTNTAFYFFCALFCLSCSNKTLEQVGKDFRATPVRNSSLDFSGLESITGVTTTKATLSWSDVLEASTYQIFQATGDAEEFVITTVNSPTSQYQVTDLEPNTRYRFRVCGTDDKGIPDPNENFVEVTTKKMGSFSVIEDMATSVGVSVLSEDLDCTDEYGNTPTYSISSTSDSHANCSISSGKVSCTPTAVTGVPTWNATVTVACSLNDYTYEEAFILSVN